VKIRAIKGDSHEKIFKPTENDYVTIGFTDLRFQVAIKKQIIYK
jgi:hypothetical protein